MCPPLVTVSFTSNSVAFISNGYIQLPELAVIILIPYTVIIPLYHIEDSIL